MVYENTVDDPDSEDFNINSWYHISPHRFDSFKLQPPKQNWQKFMNSNLGVNFFGSRSKALDFGAWGMMSIKPKRIGIDDPQATSRYLQTPLHLYHAELNLQNPKEYYNDEEMSREAWGIARAAGIVSDYNHRSGFLGAAINGHERMPEIQRAYQEHLKKNNVDGLTFTSHDLETGYPSVVVTDPSRIRITRRENPGTVKDLEDRYFNDRYNR